MMWLMHWKHMLRLYRCEAMEMIAQNPATHVVRETCIYSGSFHPAVLLRPDMRIP